MSNNPLGKSSEYLNGYDRSALYAVPRRQYRAEKLAQSPFSSVGIDVWNCFELSWLDKAGKPVVALLQITVPSESAAIVESKSLKLYLGGFSNERFVDSTEIAAVIRSDLCDALGSDSITLKLLAPEAWRAANILRAPGECLDSLSIVEREFRYAPELLDSTNKQCSLEQNFTVHTNLFRSLCPVTSQPDWATVIIGAQGGKWHFGSLLSYIVSFRNHAGFHEHCCETIFHDLMQYCAPKKLCVQCCFTRRGGIDINPLRSSESGYAPFQFFEFSRLARQ